MESEFLSRMALAIGAPLPILRVLLSLLANYPFALIQRRYFENKSPTSKHIYFMMAGLTLSWFNFGWDSLHSIASVCCNYIILQLLGGTGPSIAASFIFNMSYLLVGYWNFSSSGYDVNWTTPHCVLTLRLIGLAFDVYDGQNDEKELSAEQKLCAVKNAPTLLEMGGFTFFFGGYLVGPQFTLRRYLDFTHNRFIDEKTGHPVPSYVPAIKCLLAGGIYLTLYQVVGPYFPPDSLYSEAFSNFAYWRKCVHVGLFAKFHLYKYIGVWLLAEGSCTLAGITYNGRDSYGDVLWDGCANVRMWAYETLCSFREIIASFNLNTNKWVASYVYKRMKFMNNKNISQVSTLVFLSVWHGFYSGYYFCFFNEFLAMKFENEATAMCRKNPALVRLSENLVFAVLWRMLRTLFVVVGMGYCLVPFVVLTFDRWFQVYKSMYFIGHIICIGWILVAPFLKRLIVPPRRD